MSPKEIALGFYKMDLAQEQDAISMFHKDCELHWHSTKGFVRLGHSDIQKMFANIQKTYKSFN